GGGRVVEPQRGAVGCLGQQRLGKRRDGSEVARDACVQAKQEIGQQGDASCLLVVPPDDLAEARQTLGDGRERGLDALALLQLDSWRVGQSLHHAQGGVGQGGGFAMKGGGDAARLAHRRL